MCTIFVGVGALDDPPKIVQNNAGGRVPPLHKLYLLERYLRLPLTRELSPQVTEGEKSIGITAILVSPSVFCLRQNPPPSSDGGKVLYEFSAGG